MKLANKVVHYSFDFETLIEVVNHVFSYDSFRIFSRVNVQVVYLESNT